MTAKTPTPQGISRLLAAAGFRRSESSATAIRGWRNHSSGYVVRAGRESGQVRVHHETGLLRTEGTDRDRRAKTEEAYAKAIEAAGWSVLRQEGGYFAPLIVTASLLAAGEPGPVTEIQLDSAEVRALLEGAQARRGDDLRPDSRAEIAARLEALRLEDDPSSSLTDLA